MPEEVEHSPTSTLFQRFRLLLWKSYLWHRYYWWWTILEIVARCFAVLFFGLRISDNIHLTTHSATLPKTHSRSDLLDTIAKREYFAYGPSTKFTDQLMENFVAKLEQEKHFNESTIELVSFLNEHDLVVYAVNRSISMKEEPMAIFFILEESGSDHDDFKVPDIFKYEIRQSVAHNTRMLSAGDTTPGPSHKRDDYWTGGFAAVQLLLNEEFIRIKLNDSFWSPLSDVEFQAFPYPAYETSIIKRENILSAVVLYFILAEVALSVPFITSIIFEKQNGVKDLMRIHHTEDTLIWLSWFLKSFIVIIISVTLMTIILIIPFKGHATQSVRYTDFSVLWTFFLSFGTANLCLVLFLSSLFNKAIIASLVHMCVHYFSLVVLFVSVGLNLRRTIEFFWPSPTVVIFKGIRFMVTAEAHNIPFNWTTAVKLHANESNLVFLPYLFILGVEMLVYLSLALLFGQINPGEFGSRKSLSNAVSRFIFGNKGKRATTESRQVHVYQSINKSGNASSNLESSLGAEIREPINSDREPSIRIEGLHKEFDDVHALEKIDLEFYENEISVLLGSKNSGKTTLLSILAGSIRFDNGFIYYKGSDVSDDLSMLKNDLGICFKEDRLIHCMSAVQHLLFFGMLKGLSKSDAAEEAEQYLIKLEMHHQRHYSVGSLSQVAKRKLCIAICLIGERKVLLLDEPLEGLDSKSKMKIWNLLSDMRTDRTIIISTSSAREAESLADRITIMESGLVIAHGTPKFLKKNIGIHYEILVSTRRENFDDVTAEITKVVNVTVERKMENEIVYQVSLDDLSKFPDLFENLEKNSQLLDISNIGVAFNTIEHVLMKTGGLTNHPPVNSESIPGVLRSEYDSGKTKI